MAMTLFDHHRRLEDLEMLTATLAEAFSADPTKREVLAEVRHRLQTRGANGAADLLAGDLVSAPYRR